MAYHHYTPGVRTHDDGFGTDIVPTPAPPPQGFTTDPNAYITPSPTDLVPPAYPKPGGAPFMPPAPPTPLVPLTPMTTGPSVFDSVKDKLVSPGPFGFAWGWWVAGGAAVFLYTRNSRPSVTVAANRKRSRR